MQLLFLLLLSLAAFAAAAPSWARSDDVEQRDPLKDGPLIDPAEMTSSPVPVATDYATMPVGTYTSTAGRSVVVIVVLSPTTTAADDDPESTLEPCPPECDCSWIQDKEGEDASRTRTAGSVWPEKRGRCETGDFIMMEYDDDFANGNDAWL
ncbi:hypothetical protein AK830_g10624 [Neonectria ditissima]|uniref:Uncharacterized protein n=1 Tax=Neonectria ditissima TaxID=78410 RepID=A0A0P7B656_9HYPO|nr:hypothetical protein AK830_g10624 [Neonectria ditissima]